jgi:hypothetical protein
MTTGNLWADLALVIVTAVVSAVGGYFANRTKPKDPQPPQPKDGFLR